MGKFYLTTTYPLQDQRHALHQSYLTITAEAAVLCRSLLLPPPAPS